MAGKIFINYRRDDSASHALAVAQYFENNFGKSNIFIDVDRSRAGLKYKLRQCKVMLAIIGPNWVDARDEKSDSRRLDDPEDWVRVEIERALAQKILVIPVLVAGATLPSKSDLPQSLQPLLEHHRATMTTRHGMAGLARDVADLTVRRPWSRMVATASALILGGYLVAHASALILGGYLVTHQLGAPVSKRDAGAAEAEAKRVADPALSVTPGSGKTFRDPLADGEPCPMCPEMVVAPAGLLRWDRRQASRNPGLAKYRCL